MGFLIKSAFWLSLVIMLLPMGPDSEQLGTKNIGASEAINLATSTYIDATGFCDRNPSACETGSDVIEVFKLKAQYGAKLVYQYLDGGNGLESAASEPVSKTSGTLNAQDLQVSWRAPEPANNG